MKANAFVAVVSALLAIAVTGSLVAVGYSGLNTVLPLLPLLLLFWLACRIPRKEIGFVLGNRSGYLLAVATPLVVIGLLSALAFAFGLTDTSTTQWSATAINFLVIFALTFVLAIVTEEGFFRGWLWAALQRSGYSETTVIFATAVAFALWHAPEVTLSVEFALPAQQIPVLLLNAVVIGATWGLLRAISHSVVVTSLCHGLWNGLGYVLFGDGAEKGAFGISNTTWVGPEHGLIGLALNVAVLALLWRWWHIRKQLPARDLAG
jgi:hypothetical protein